MRPPITFKALSRLLALCFALFALHAHAAIDNADLLDSVLTRYQSAASGWAATITDSASWLFWTLVLISMVWTFGMMALRRADIGEFFAEFVRFTIFTGFFWWLLTNGPSFAKSIMDGLRQVGSNATGLTSALSPSGVVDVGFAIFDKVIDQSSMWSPVNSAVGIIIAALILIILALVGVNMLLLLVSGWILAYAGIFFLGFGGARWTSEMAISYYKTVLGVAAQLLVMVLIVGIGKTFLDDYYGRMSEGITIKELGVMSIVSLILLMLVNKLPSLVSGIITGASIGHAGIGSFGAGMAVGAAGMAAAAAATGGAMFAASAANAAGGASALTAAFAKANENVQSGADVLTSLWAGSNDDAGKREVSTGSTPYAEAAGYASIGAAQDLGSDAALRAAGQGGSARARPTSPPEPGRGRANEARGSAGSGSTGRADGGRQQGAGGLMSSVGTAGLIAADAAANLAKGSAQAAREKMSSLKDAAAERIAETPGGRIAATLKTASGNDPSRAVLESAPMFEGNNLAGADALDAEAAAEVAAFANRDTTSTWPGTG